MGVFAIIRIFTGFIVGYFIYHIVKAQWEHRRIRRGTGYPSLGVIEVISIFIGVLGCLAWNFFWIFALGV